MRIIVKSDFAVSEKVWGETVALAKGFVGEWYDTTSGWCGIQSHRTSAVWTHAGLFHGPANEKRDVIIIRARAVGFDHLEEGFGMREPVVFQLEQNDDGLWRPVIA